jgi:hypothetical protein
MKRTPNFKENFPLLLNSMNNFQDLNDLDLRHHLQVQSSFAMERSYTFHIADATIAEE